MNIPRGLELILRDCAKTAAQAQTHAMRDEIDDAVRELSVEPFSAASIDLRLASLKAYKEIFDPERVISSYSERVVSYRRHLARSVDIAPGVPPRVPALKTIEQCTPPVKPLPSKQDRELLQRRNARALQVGEERHTKELVIHEHYVRQHEEWQTRVADYAFQAALSAVLSMEETYQDHVKGARGPWPGDAYPEWVAPDPQTQSLLIDSYNRGAREAAKHDI